LDGNSAAVAAKSCLLVTEDGYTKAIATEPAAPNRTETGGTIGTESRSKVTRNPAPQDAATSTHGATKNQQNAGKTIVFPMYCGSSGMEDNGLEQTAETRGKVHSVDDVARNPARSTVGEESRPGDELLAELLSHWRALDEAQRLDVLNVARRLHRMR
jgi:hypothetical protein